MGASFLPEHAVCLAPMAGFTDATFRALCHAHGADVAYTEMISAKGLFEANAKTNFLYRPADANERLVVQLFGRDPHILAEAAALVERALGEQLLAIDLNMGCPVKKIAGNGEGSALMREPDLAGRIIRTVADAVHAPVTVKFRKGWDEQSVNAVSFARMCEDNGAAALCIHGRTREQLYAGAADWEIILEVVRAVRIPVIGNGDVKSGEDARRLFETTGVAGVMIGRAALGNPFLFEEVHAALNGLPYEPPSIETRRALAMRHVREAIALKGDHAALEMRKHMAFYVRGLPNAANLRMKLQTCTTIDEFERIWA